MQTADGVFNMKIVSSVRAGTLQSFASSPRQRPGMSRNPANMWTQAQSQRVQGGGGDSGAATGTLKARMGCSSVFGNCPTFP